MIEVNAYEDIPFEGSH